MIALMEIASARLLSPYLAPGQLSVGSSISATHTAPTPVGVTVTAEATYRGREGKMYAFEVVARDPAGEVGRATHLRAVVETERLVKAAERRVENVSGGAETGKGKGEAL
jgi:fluoroacetyl-CoA thioesterase